MNLLPFLKESICSWCYRELEWDQMVACSDDCRDELIIREILGGNAKIYMEG